MINKENIGDYKKRYEWYRHHAWAGLGLLSIVLAIRYFFPLPDFLLLPIVVVLIIYILVALMFSYKYSIALSAREEEHMSLSESHGEIMSTDIEKARLKVEKKRVKAGVKAQKKER
jgi:hypothetical protein